MRVLIRLLVLIIAVWLAPSPALARGGDEGARPACTAANSDRVTIDEVWSNVSRLRNRCISVRGYRLGDVIFTNQHALYRYSARRSSTATGIVGIPYPVRLEGGPGLMRGVYYGRVESCRETQRNFARTLRNLQRQPDTGEIVLVHLYGFCATSAGPAVRVERADERPSSDLRRLTGDRLRASLGELVPIDERYRYRAILPWLTDIATSGCAAEFKMRALPPGGPPEGEGVPVAVPDLGPAQRAQVARWCATAARQHALFAVGSSSPGASEPGTRVDVVLCLCVTRDCTGRWPVALIDTGWGVERPYFCQRAKLRPQSSTISEDGRQSDFGDYSYEFANEWIVGGGWQDWGFPEPGR